GAAHVPRGFPELSSDIRSVHLSTGRTGKHGVTVSECFGCLLLGVSRLARWPVLDRSLAESLRRVANEAADAVPHALVSVGDLVPGLLQPAFLLDNGRLGTIVVFSQPG